jgi:hypothetical protein
MSSEKEALTLLLLAGSIWCVLEVCRMIHNLNVGLELMNAEMVAAAERYANRDNDA